MSLSRGSDVIASAGHGTVRADFQRSVSVRVGTGASSLSCHVSSVKSLAQELGGALRGYGISAFVAHECIEPTKDWQNEIMAALQTMNALVALLTPEFHESKWTDQEIGVAIGRQVPVLAGRMGKDPYGFIGRFQAFTVNKLQLDQTAETIARILVANPKTRGAMAEGIVAAFEASNSFAEAKLSVEHFSLLTELAKPLRERALQAAKTNFQISNSYGVPRRLRQLLDSLQ